MEQFIEWIKQPWPWWIAGPMIGLIVPTLLIVGGKAFGISSSLRHVCAMCVPANIPFFTYDWKKELWNIAFVIGVAIGGFIGHNLLANPEMIEVAESTQRDLAALGITDYRSIMPHEIFTWENLFTAKGLLFFVIGGFLVGFGTRYAGGCTSGHAIMGISSLQWPSVVATIFFMAGGFLMTHLFLGPLMKLVGF
ncbi:YeeE/YedE family protein [Aquiflexum gelatinilyticum]|uniref:YeeE/YedE family protein n=1 Tax=Aquiflexum gelatinilyticum TaxID=2961943 RepID=A0A9X2SZ94_9BACT|nr:YeeE/YedE family protein [Aquiflexum gelatinilyticum]MCR9016397.1 YeeE/YedE family protein [Aquiflexum gelatinilyticum]MCS4435052.1 YeeE/YedE family protein [Aquiflexum gelatinilyticum]